MFVLISVVMYYFTPEGYNYSFCLGIMTLYLLQNSCWLILNRDKRKLRFELLFMISFFFVNLVYPVFYAPIYPSWSFFAMEFNRHVINQATALAYMAYAFYMLGICDRPWQSRPEPTQPTFRVRPAYMIFLGAIAVACFALFVISGGYQALGNVYSGGGNLKEVGVFSYFSILYTIAALLMATFLFQTKGIWRWGGLGVLGVFMLALLTTGSRQFSLSIVLILIVGFSLHVYRLKGWQVILLLIGGAVMLNVIMLVRTCGLDFDSWQDKIDSVHSVSQLDIFEDLTINSINLYVLVDWGNTHDLSWLHGFLIDLASPIPKLGSWIVQHYNEPSEWLNGGDLPSYILLGGCAGWGTGTNMVGELFRSFGAIGTCCFMFGLGLLLREAYYRANTSAYWYAFYMLMVGHAVIYSRGPFLYDPRTIVWGLALLWLIIHSVERYYSVFRKEGTA